MRGPWSEGRVKKLFETAEGAKRFADPHDKAARQAGDFKGIPRIQEIGIVTVEGGARLIDCQMPSGRAS